MNPEDRQAIDGLFNRIEDVARNSPPRDRQAEHLIQQRLAEYAPAPYYMAQTILIQEEALRQAQERIQELERRDSGAGGFLGGLLGGGSREPARPAGRQRSPWGDPTPDYGRRGSGFGGGGFLAGAAQAALGVTGGVLLGSAIAGMLGGEAQADEYDSGDGGEADAGADAGGDDLGGGGDFDVGGDF